MLPEDGGVEGGEGARLERYLEVVTLARGEGRATGAHIERRGRGIVLRRLEDGTLLPVVYGDALHVVEGEASEVDLSVLCIPQLDSVVEDSYVLRTHTADVHRLEPSDTPVVLDLHPCEVAEGVGDRDGRETLEGLPRQALHGDDLT